MLTSPTGRAGAPLFVALGGGAYAATAIQSKALNSKGNLKSNVVKKKNIAKNAVVTSKIKSGKVTGSKLSDGSVSAEKLGSLTLRPGTPVTVTGGAGQNANWVIGTATASCESGEKLISGTGEWTDEGANDELALQEIVYSDSTVTVKGANDQGANRTLLATALCLASSS